MTDNNIKNQSDKEVKTKTSVKKERITEITSGFVAGLINGMFGGGGGMVVVPILMHKFKMPAKKAHATAILIILPLSIISGLFYSVFGSFEISVGAWVGIGVVVGGMIGAFLLKNLKNRVVKIIFALLMAIAGIKMLFF